MTTPTIPALSVDPSGATSDPLLGFSLADINAEFPLFTASFNDGPQAQTVVCLNSIDRPYQLPICSVAPVAWTAPAGGWSTVVYQPPPVPPVVQGTPEPNLLIVMMLGVLFIVLRTWMHRRAR